MRQVNISPIRAVERALDVLFAFSIDKYEMTIEELVKITKLPKSTVYRILYTLERRGLIRFDEETLKYKPGFGLYQLSALMPYLLNIHQEAKEDLDKLHERTGQTVIMAVRDDDHIVYVYKKEKSEGLKYASVVGQRRPYFYGVLGPVLLAYLPDRDIERILKTHIPKHTPYTVTNKKIIKQRLKKIKIEGFYIEKNETGIGATGIGAPIFDTNGNVVAAIGVIGPSATMDASLETFKTHLLETSRSISSKMGYSINK